MTEQIQTRPHIQPSAAMDEAYAAVETALTRTTNARAGFETMVGRAETEFRAMAERFLALHTRHAERLSLMLSNAGRTPDADGSLMGTVNRAVVATRAFFDRIDADVIPQVVQGEESVIAAYGDAMETDLPADEHNVLSAMMSELQTLVAEANARS